jgi:hypothetical protein
MKPIIPPTAIKRCELGSNDGEYSQLTAAHEHAHLHCRRLAFVVACASGIQHTLVRPVRALPLRTRWHRRHLEDMYGYCEEWYAKNRCKPFGSYTMRTVNGSCQLNRRLFLARFASNVSDLAAPNTNLMMISYPACGSTITSSPQLDHHYP